MDLTFSWNKSLIVSFVWMGKRRECISPCGISLVPMFTGVLALITMRRLTTFNPSKICPQHERRSLPGCGCIGQIFISCQLLGRCHPSPSNKRRFSRPKNAFDSVDQTILFSVLCCNGMPVEFVRLPRTLYSNTYASAKAAVR